MIRSLDLFENKDVQLPRNIVDHGSSPRFIIVFLIEIAIIRDTVSRFLTYHLWCFKVNVPRIMCNISLFPYYGYFPTCQVRVVRFYQSCSPPPPPPLPPPPPHPPPPPRSPDPSGHSRTSTASSRSQWALPDLNRELQIAVNRDFQVAVGTAGPQPRLPDRSGHCRTSTATSRSQWALPDLNGKNVRKDVR